MNLLASSPLTGLTLDHLFRTYRTAVFGICYAYTKSQDEANDLVQETFVKAHLGLPGFEGRSHPKTWLTRIAINQCLTRMQMNKRGKRNLEAYLENASREQAMEREDQPIANLGMEEVLKRADDTTRKVLLLAFRDGLTHSEIAKTLGVSRVAVTRRITRFKDRSRPAPEKPARTSKPGFTGRVVSAGWTMESAAYPETPGLPMRQRMAV